MPTMKRPYRLVTGAVLATVAMALSACSLDNQKMPALSGPSELALSLAMTATPDQIPRDGSSQSIVTVTVRDPQGRPIVGQHISLALGSNAPQGASLSQSEVVTGSTGQATFAVTAPALGSTGNILITATPVGTNGANDVGRVIQIIATPQNGTVPTAGFTFSPTSPDVGQPVTFNASTTQDEGVSCTSCTFTWDFGDGTGTGMIATHAFSSGGSYIVTLTATDSGGSSSTTRQTVAVSAPSIPTGVGVTSSPSTPIAKQAATFTATATPATNHRIVSYQFVWGDGDSNPPQASPTIQHTYAQAGPYLLTLTVRDDLNQSTTTNTVITVSSGLSATFTTSVSGTTVTFTATASSSVASTITDYAWDFETDGTYDTNGSSSSVSHDYGASGTYRATLKVTDNRGATQTYAANVTVP